MSGIPPLVLVHGSMHGAWCWEPLIAELARRGISAQTAEFPGHGTRVAEAAAASLETYADAVTGVVDSVGADTVVLVAHSMGGTPTAMAVARRPARVAHVVYLSAQALADGDRPLDPVPAERVARYRADAAANGGVYRIADDEIWRLWLSSMPRHDPRVEWALERITPQPLRPMEERAALAGYYAIDLRRTYIWPRDDHGNVRLRMERSLANLGGAVRYVEMPGDHDVMISNPRGTAEVIAAALTES